jgi:nicotinamidase/pyrazinamidase
VETGPGDALLVVDLQRDFLPGGALAVRGGDEIVPVLGAYARHFRAHDLQVFLTRDWHPPDHCSFRAHGGPWPPHCIAGSSGAEPPAGFDAPADAVVVHKGMSPEKDAYSGFDGTPLDRALREAGARRLFVGGLATDYCVLATVRDARRLGYAVRLLVDSIRAVDVAPGDGRRAEDDMLRLGAIPTRLSDLAP